VTLNLGDAGCGVDWEPGTSMVVLGYVDEESRVAANLCTGSTVSTDPAYDEITSALGTASEPLSGQDLVELNRSTKDLLRRFTLAVGVIALAALGVLARRRWRPSAGRRPV